MLAILFTTNQNHFLLFWPKDNLKGFGRHEDSIINGRGENPAAMDALGSQLSANHAVIKRDYELMKWVNANSFRTSHYPYSEENLRMADREGFLVIDECAAVGFMSSLKNLVKRISRGSF